MLILLTFLAVLLVIVCITISFGNAHDQQMKSYRNPWGGVLRGNTQSED